MLVTAGSKSELRPKKLSALLELNSRAAGCGCVRRGKLTDFRWISSSFATAVTTSVGQNGQHA